MTRLQIIDEFLAYYKERERKREQRRGKRRLLVTTALTITLVALITVGLTTAPLNHYTNSAINELGFGQTKITVDEDFDGWDKKEVRLTIPQPWDGLVPGVARVMFVPTILDETSTDYIASDLGSMPTSMTGQTEMVLGDIVLTFATDWEDHWFYKDGFFYYKTVLYPETGRSETPVLLKKVSLNPAGTDLEEKYDGSLARVNVEVLASILQAGGSASDAGKVLDTQWGVQVNGDLVSPKT